MNTAYTLKSRLKAREAEYSQNTRIRIHRAISWLKRAEGEPKDQDARFIFLWIAFNSAYAQEFDGTNRTQHRRSRPWRLCRSAAVTTCQRQRLSLATRTCRRFAGVPSLGDRTTDEATRFHYNSGASNAGGIE